eukprot:GEMP01027236.1.p1 GENE.GEMP01027236.1~~GEMP01027236.1.p1  ORF type:complete len:561 (+),score=111.12 GEMP01027236.1:21-1703(+)
MSGRRATPVLASPPAQAPTNGEWVFVQFGAVDKAAVRNTFDKADVPVDGGVIEGTNAELIYEARWHSDPTTFGLLPIEEDSSEMKVLKGPIKWLRVGRKPQYAAGPFHTGDRFIRRNFADQLAGTNAPSSSSSKLQFRFATIEDADDCPLASMDVAPTCVASFEFPIRDVNSLTFSRSDVKVGAKRERRRSLQSNRENVCYVGDVTFRADTIFLGAMKQRKITLFPTEYYTMKVRIPSEEAEAKEEEETEIHWFEARNEVIDLFSAAKRKKLVSEAKKKRITDGDVVNLLEAKESLQAKIDENALPEGHGVVATEDAMRRVLPAWDTSATKASEIYRAGLEIVFPHELVDALHCPPMLLQAISKPSFFKNRSEKDLWMATKSKTLYLMLKSRHLNHVVPANEVEATTYGQKLQLVLSLIWTYTACHRSKSLASKNDAHKRVLSSLHNMANGSMLASTIVNVFFEESALMVGSRGQSGQTTVFDKKKLLCHLIVLILTLVPKAHFDFNELATDLDETPAALRVYIMYVGCSMSSSDSLEATLKDTFTLHKPRPKIKGKKKR